ncbi:hypothetical protein GF352_04410 [archaeon]|nr:hypothetical protein [archaeon]
MRVDKVVKGVLILVVVTTVTVFFYYLFLGQEPFFDEGIKSYDEITFSDKESIWDDFQFFIDKVNKPKIIDNFILLVNDCLTANGFNETLVSEVDDFLRKNDIELIDFYNISNTSQVIRCIITSAQTMISRGVTDEINITYLVMDFFDSANQLHEEVVFSEQETSGLIREVSLINNSLPDEEVFNHFLIIINDSDIDKYKEELVDYIKCNLIGNDNCLKRFSVNNIYLSNASRVVLSMPLLRDYEFLNQSIGISLETHNDDLLSRGYDDFYSRTDYYDNLTVSFTGASGNGLFNDWFDFDYNSTEVMIDLSNVTVFCNPKLPGVSVDFFNSVGFNLTGFYDCDFSQVFNTDLTTGVKHYLNNSLVFLTCKDDDCYRLVINELSGNHSLEFDALSDYLAYSINYLN